VLAHQPAGVVVCDPVPSGGVGSDADFGAGCSKWIQFQAGGQPDMQRMTHWMDHYRAAHELGHEDLQLSKTEAPWLAKALGVTHAAVGSITDSAGNLTLTYDLIAVPSGKAVGKPLSITGTREQIIAALPQMAASIAVRLGILHPSIPATVELSAADLETVGRARWGASDKLSNADAARLDALAAQSPLACLTSAYSMPRRRAGTLAARLEQLLKLAPGNQYSLASMAYIDADELRADQPLIAQFAKEHPNSYLARWTSHVSNRLLQHDAEAQRDLVALERINPNNPSVWLTVTRVAQEKADRIRRGRIAVAIRPEEWSQLQPLYQEEFAAASKSVALDPKYGHGWNELAIAATVVDKPAVADDALWKAVQLGFNPWEAYSWGLQMYQPKWSPNTVKLEQLATQAAALPDASFHIGEIQDALQQSGLQDYARSLSTNLMAKVQSDLAQHPNDPDALYAAGVFFYAQGVYGRAVPALQKVLAVEPDNLDARADLAEAYDRTGDIRKSEIEYRAVLEQQPYRWGIHYHMGLALKKRGKFSEAIDEFHKALEANPGLIDANFGLALIAEEQHQPKEAIHQLEIVVRADPTYTQALEQLIALYATHGRLDDAKRACEYTLRLEPRKAGLHAELGYILAEKHENEQSAKESSLALSLDPNNVTAHENLGDVLNDMGKHAEAKEEWTWVVTHAPDHPDAREARKNLGQNP
jgi:tetratricopeptide (TPR) repeat protein